MEKRKMQKNKTAATMIALFLAFTIALTLVALPTANAHTPPWQVPTYSFINVSPNPIGAGQTVNVNFWLNIPPPTASGQYGDRWTNMTVVITKPNGNTETLKPFTSDAVGGAYTTYTPDVVGNYTFQMVFSGETVLGNNLAPPAFPGAPPNPNIGDYYLPSKSNIFTLTVQQEPLTYPLAVPLPTNYWTRPIYGENNEWYSISGNWLGLAASTFAATGMYNATGNYNPYTTAPNTAHILWTKPEAFGGMIGGEYGSSQTANYYSTSQYEPKFAPIIMQGILYYTMYPGSSTHPAGWAAVDLRTGQTLWTKKTTEVLRTGQIINVITPNQYGALAYLWSIPMAQAGFMGAQTTYNMYDAMTGDFILSVVNGTTMTLTSDDNGDLIGYYINTTNAVPGNPFSPITAASLTMWNSTRMINLAIANYAGGPPVENQWMWRPPLNATLDFKTGIQWSVPLPMQDLAGKPLSLDMETFGFTMPGYLLSIAAVQSNVVLLRGTLGFLYNPGWTEQAGFSAIDGHKLWGPTNITQVPFSIVYTGGVWSGSGAYVELTESSLSITGYSLTTGEKLWGPTALPNASPFSSLGSNAIVANGNIYIWLYGGDVYSYNIRTGALNWQYHTPTAGYESPYGRNSIWTFTVGTIADGKLFVPEGHMYSPPLYHGAQQLALNLTTGEVVWSIDAFDVTSGPAISDGVMVTLNAYDNQIYAYGKGPTKVTVTAPDTAYPAGTPMVIRGTVTDISAGTQQDAVAMNFPNGLPAIADESMSDWMEYVYMQQPCPTNATGVEVTIDAVDPNGNFINIGTATSDAYGGFGYAWKTPDVPGKYAIIATFAGSESYWTSFAETFAVVTETPAATPTPTPLVLPPYETYTIGAAVAVIIAIAIAVVLLLRRH
jgi:outer membrane protein assembly factor BamB